MSRVPGALAGTLLCLALAAAGGARAGAAGGPAHASSGAATARQSTVLFTDVTSTARVGTRAIIGGGLASGSAWRDFDNDGLPDLFVGNHYDMPALFKNQGDGTFANVTTSVMRRPRGIVNGKWGDQHGSAWADVNKDGNPDLLVLVGAQEGEGSGPNQLYINDGAGRLVDQAVPYQIDYPYSRGRTPLWIDYDNDGYLDMFQGAKKRPDGTAPPTIFHQAGGVFTDVRHEVGFLPINSLSGFASDINRDGRLELIYQGWKLTSPSAPFVSNIDIIDTTGPTFGNVTPMAFRGTWPDLAIADYDGDLRPDIFFCNTWAATATSPFGHDLYLNRATGFVRVLGQERAATNILQRSCSPSAIAADFDNDMDIDIFVDAGAKAGAQRSNFILWNRGNGTFEADATASGAVGRVTGSPDSASAADYDVDGFMDVYLTYNRAGSQLYRNGGNANHWLEIDLHGITSNADAIGAQVYVTAGGVTQLREQNGGVHRYWSQDDHRLHVGLGANVTASEVLVTWPSGAVSQLSDVAADGVISITEPVAGARSSRSERPVAQLG